MIKVNSHRPLVHWLLAFALLFTQFPAALSAQQAGAQTAPALKWTRSHDYDVQHYRLNFGFDWQQK
ncbi:MAG TPA: hypothetical protein VEF04_12775, partial [Blastocatellia bacterium]|nr:hypothetical protein [Blastocatellia bacterium]